MANIKVRRASVKLLVAGADITTSAAPDLLGFTFTDNESGKADDINVTLANDHGKWSAGWIPKKGDTIKATIICEGEGSENKSLYCGVFTIDKISAQFSPGVVTIGAVSVPLKTTARRETKSAAWEGADLKKIAEEIAGNAGLSCIFDSAEAPRYDRIDQRQESDLGFLNRLCDEAGLNLKVTDDQLVVFDQKKYEDAAPVGAIINGKSNIVGSPSFESGAFDLYKECVAAYFDSASEELIEKTFKDANVTDGLTFKILDRCATIAEAERKAHAKLRSLNKNEITASIALAGELYYCAGQIVAVVGFGAFDGNYLIETATHSVESGHAVALKMRRTNKSF
jgi:phage protein D